MYDSEGEEEEDVRELYLSAGGRATSSSPSTSTSTSSPYGRRSPRSTASMVADRSSSAHHRQQQQRDTKKPRRSGLTDADDDIDVDDVSDDERCSWAAAGTATGNVGAACTLPEDEQAFEEDLRTHRGFTIKRMIGDGNCLFRAVADQVYGDPDMHDEVRKRCMDYMERERDHYSQFVAEDFSAYIRRKRRDKEFGNHVEIQAISEIYNRPIEVYAHGHRGPINIFHKNYFTEYAPIRLSYHYGNHYNSVIDPENPSVGVGLGLPQLSNPALEMERAIEESIEETMYKDVLAASEFEATQNQIEEQVLLQSALEAGAVGSAEPLDREGDTLMEAGTVEDDLLAAALRQSELEYWEHLSHDSS